MATDILQEVYEQYIKPLSPEQRLKLVEMIAHDLAEAQPRYDWVSVRGIAPDLLNGEDAQEWVSRGRGGILRQR
ncbi:MAG: hypothetical protein HPY54_13105 [Chthonomonadetes bacterium]|nr:hypothetical protein [Chthonomonadetes bacterium]